MLVRLIGKSHLDPMWKRISDRHNIPEIYDWLVNEQMFLIYGALMGVLLGFVLSLRKFTLRYQFHQLGWTTMG